MTSTTHPARHWWLDAAARTTDGEPPPAATLTVRCHRRLRGPFTGAHFLLHQAVPQLVERDSELVAAARALEVESIAPELMGLVPTPPQTLTNLAVAKERTRFYPATRALRIAHGVAELLMDWARSAHPKGVTLAFRGLDDADPTDRDLVAALLRRCDPAALTVVVDGAGAADDLLGKALSAHAHRAPRLPFSDGELLPDGDPAQQYVDADGTSDAPRLRRAYDALPADERARRHSARAALLAGRNEPTLRLGAIPYHLERGTDPRGAGVAALVEAVTACFDKGFYEAVIDLAERGRALLGPGDTSRTYWNLTHKIGACLCYLGRGHDAFAYFEEMRRGSTSPDVHMGTAYLMAMLYTRFLPKDDHDEDLALAWVNTAISIADVHPEPRKRILVRAFMRNARALVELHRGDVDRSLALVDEAMAITDEEFGPDEQLLHRSVLLYNRAQVRGARHDHVDSLRDYDEVIGRDPDYGDYYFERAAQHRALGRHREALTDYASAIRLSPPFYEAHFNRADLLRELGDEAGALRDLDHALDLEPEHVDSLVHRADLYLGRGDLDRAAADIDRGLVLAPDHPQLLAARGALAADRGDTETAYDSYSAALRADPACVAAWANRAVLAFEAGQPGQAVDDLDAALALADDTELRVNRAVALQALGEHRRAADDLDRAVHSASGAPDPELLFLRGLSRHALGEETAALTDWRAHLAAYASVDASPHAAEIHERAGAALREGAA
ncbi:tetratricopeptide repeat protein [Streptomyces sp. VRA16 Mangrove soil]|uniref:tetratricopeptide repeat protein n=1 Tax=Streptomyces sp. VRA16 Mangrove soil TaxID=2817434 RepID=UPI001A9CBA99|nr:tetratricopeptide repeat protein [Streptomyces sp. VRA16 Mangrove soil]MBO1332219.1 tetratricopeptide repeat protein [Streptomyces sp. VRA16 Mangrove soil]